MKSRRVGLGLAVAGMLCTFALPAGAEVSLTEGHALRQRQAKAKRGRGALGPEAQGSFQLVDASGLRYFINTDITFTTTSSASGAASDAIYDAPVAASTSAGGTTMATLSEAFDGYGSLCVSLSGSTGPCDRVSPDYVVYNPGAPAASECGGRQAAYVAQTVGTLSVTRKVYVPANDTFIRWMNVLTNNDVVPQSFNVVMANNIGSDADTVIGPTSDGDTLVELTDSWVTTFGAFTGGVSPWVRLGHVLQHPGGRVGLNSVSFANPDVVFWSYPVTLQPGETGIIMTFATGQASRAAAAAKADALSRLPFTALQCMTPLEKRQVLNFDAVKKGDLNNDGMIDLVFRRTTTNENTSWLMDGVTRTAEVAINPATPASANQSIVGIDDFNANGANDLVFNDSTNNAVEFWLMGGPNGTDRQGAPVPLTGAAPPALNWKLSATGDFNGDNQPDLVWRNFTSQKIVIWTMNGTSRVGAIIPTPDQAVNFNWRIVAALDFNNDGNRDFLWYNDTSGKIVTWNMDASVVRIDGDFTNPPNAGNNNWKVVAGGDYSALYTPPGPPVGANDIVWRNDTSGNYVVWHMDLARQRVSGQFFSPTAPTNPTEWVVVGPR